MRLKVIMIKKTFLYSILTIALCHGLFAQDKAQMATYQSELQQLFVEVYTAPTDNQRYLASESAVKLFTEALATENSIRWQWDFGNRVSVLTAPDRKFRIFSWPVVNDAGEYECFGLVQALNERTKEYDVFVLNDRSEDIVNRQEEVLAPDRWYGAVYQELIVTNHEGRTFYTLLGWNGVDNLTERKVIEPICFKSGGSQPQFGQNLFRKEPNIRRVVLEYTNTAMVTLRYEEQYVRQVERVRAKRKSSFSLSSLFAPSRRRGRGRGRGRSSRPVATAARTSAAQQERVRTAPSQKITDKKMKMIIFDQVSAQVPGMEGLYQYYVPSGAEMAYVFVNGKWELRDNAQGRATDKRLNKDFDKPIEKEPPAYQMKQEQ